MARYIDADLFERKMNYILKTYVQSPTLTKKFKDALKSVPTADVAPKSEVERLEHLRAELSKRAADLQEQCAEFAKRQLPSYCRVCSEEEAINIGREYGKTEVAREIFSEMDELLSSYSSHIVTIGIEEYAELKTKYMKGATDERN